MIILTDIFVNSIRTSRSIPGIRQGILKNVSYVLIQISTSLLHESNTTHGKTLNVYEVKHNSLCLTFVVKLDIIASEDYFRALSTGENKNNNKNKQKQNKNKNKTKTKKQKKKQKKQKKKHVVVEMWDLTMNGF